MTKVKYFMMALMVGIVLALIPTIVNATDTFTTSDGIVVNKVVSSPGIGDVELKISNIALNDEINYTWGIGRSSNASEVNKWYNLGDFNSNNKIANITLSYNDGGVGKILKETNTAWLYIKDNTNNKMIVNALKIDLTLPVTRAFKISKVTGSDSSFRNFNIKTVYGITNLYYNIQKITDSKVIENYTSAKKNGMSIDTVDGLAKLEDAPQDGWTKMDESYTAIKNFYINKKITEPGIYYIWVKGKDSDSKMVYGYDVYGVDNEAPTVSSIKVTAPNSGTYKSGQTVTIRVNFSETITGTSVPTLKIKFGNCAERNLTNGTIKENYVQYTYNIQDSDKGQLATVSLTGGKIKDSFDNDAKLSCPIISGNTIKANVEGTTINNTDNQDKTNNNPSDNTTAGGNTTKKDNTTAGGVIPQTGFGIGLISVIVLLIGGSIVGFIKHNKLKEI